MWQLVAVLWFRCLLLDYCERLDHFLRDLFNRLRIVSVWIWCGSCCYDSFESILCSFTVVVTLVTNRGGCNSYGILRRLVRTLWVILAAIQAAALAPNLNLFQIRGILIICFATGTAFIEDDGTAGQLLHSDRALATFTGFILRSGHLTATLRGCIRLGW